MDRRPQDPDRPRRGTLRRAAAAARSSLRRYPPELVASLPSAPGTPARPLRDLLAELAPHGLAACWLGHASVVVTLGELTIAIDPVLSDRIGVRIGRRTIGLARRQPAPIRPESLRGVDAVLITHAHFDHLDRPTLAAMADARTAVIVPPRCAPLVPPGFGDVTELAPGSVTRIGAAEVSALAPRHWGARAWIDRRRGFCAYTVRSPEGSALFAGDTAATRAFDAAEPTDLAVFGIGAYEPWEHMHATPEQVWRMFERCGARYLLPVHHSTFELSDEPEGEPMRRLLTAAGGAGPRVLRESAGEVVVLPGSSNPGPES